MTLKIAFIGDHRDTMCSGIVILRCDRERIEFLRNYAGRWRSAFHFRNKPERCQVERGTKTAKVAVLFCPFFPIIGVSDPGGNFLPLIIDNFSEPAHAYISSTFR